MGGRLITPAESPQHVRNVDAYNECQRMMRHMSNDLAGELIAYGGRFEHAHLTVRAEIIGRLKLAADKMVDADAGRCTWDEAKDFVFANCEKPAWKEREEERQRVAALGGAILDIMQTTAPERAAALRPWE